MQALSDQIPLEPLYTTLFTQKNVSLKVLRLDKIHPTVGGNKYFKLKYNLQAARTSGKDTLLTFGGAFSNHIYATAAAGKLFGFKTIGLIRGEEHLPLNPTLTFAKAAGMQLTYISRSQYRQKNDPAFLESLYHQFGDFYRIPEGGSNALAVKGCAEIVRQLDDNFDVICTPCGTGGTLAGLLVALTPGQKALGFSALKGGEFLYEDVKILVNAYATKFDQHLVVDKSSWEIRTDYHFGGYAKKTTALLQFMDNFHQEFQMPLEWIYSGKMFYGLFALIAEGYFPRGSRIIALHTGGIR